MILAKAHQILQEYNREIQRLNSNPASFDYADRILKARENYNKKLMDLIESEHYKVASKGS